MKILVTGAAGFIGFHAAKTLLARGDTIIGLDNLNDYYDVSLKQARLDELAPHKNFSFVKTDLKDRTAIEKLFAAQKPARVLHLAAQAGVRYSLNHPHQYIDANIAGFLNILEGCRHAGVEHLLFASSSSVYGANTKMPYSVQDNVDHPLSLYAATKKAGELMAHTYAHLYGLPVTGLRFFTVYGPWGRPDMAPFIFTRKIIAGEPIDVFNQGHHKRDFTYIDDVVEGVVRTLDQIPAANATWPAEQADPATSSAPYRLYNIGNHTPVPLLDFIAALEKEIGKPAKKNLLPMQPGDVVATYADVSELKDATGFEPKTPLAEGLKRFVGWYRGYYKV
jgi:UDP-glucuronate 4-epimerase